MPYSKNIAHPAGFALTIDEMVEKYKTMLVCKKCIHTGDYFVVVNKEKLCIDCNPVAFTREIAEELIRLSTTGSSIESFR